MCNVLIFANKDLPFFRTLHSLAFRQLGLSREGVISHSDILDLSEKLNIRLTGRTNKTVDIYSFMTHDDRLAFIENLKIERARDTVRTTVARSRRRSKLV